MVYTNRLQSLTMAIQLKPSNNENYVISFLATMSLWRFGVVQVRVPHKLVSLLPFCGPRRSRCAMRALATRSSFFLFFFLSRMPASYGQKVFNSEGRCAPTVSHTLNRPSLALSALRGVPGSGQPARPEDGTTARGKKKRGNILCTLQTLYRERERERVTHSQPSGKCLEVDGTTARG